MAQNGLYLEVVHSQEGLDLPSPRFPMTCTSCTGVSFSTVRPNDVDLSLYRTAPTPVRASASGSDQTKVPVDLDCFNTVEELQSLGVDRLKEALRSRKLKCRGTVEDLAQRLYSIKGLNSDQIPDRLLAKHTGEGKTSASCKQRIKGIQKPG